MQNGKNILFSLFSKREPSSGDEFITKTLRRGRELSIVLCNCKVLAALPLGSHSLLFQRRTWVWSPTHRVAPHIPTPAPGDLMSFSGLRRQQATGGACRNRPTHHIVIISATPTTIIKTASDGGRSKMPPKPSSVPSLKQGKPLQ